MRLKALIFFFILTFTCFGQVPSIIWEKTFGGTESDRAFSICKTHDNGFAIIGYSESGNGDVLNHHDHRDIWVVRADSNCSILWNNCYGGNLDEIGYSIQETFDGGFIFAGETNSNDGDINGQLHYWSPLGGVNDFWVVKLDSSGTIVWQKCLGGTEDDFGREVIQTRDSGFLVTGYTTSSDGDVVGFHGAEDIWSVKLDQNGVLQWSKVFGSIGSYDEGISISQSSDGGYLIAGSSNSNPHSSFSNDVWVIKINNSGQFLWQKFYGGSSNDNPSKIIATDMGDFYIAATTSSTDGDVGYNHGQSDFWIFRADSLGNIKWQTCLGGAYMEECNGASLTIDGGIIVTGYASVDDSMVNGTIGIFDFWIVKLDSSGNSQWSKCIGGTSSDIAYSIVEISPTEFIVVGFTSSNDVNVSHNNGGNDFWIVKLSTLVNSISEKNLENNEINIFQKDGKIFFEGFLIESQNFNITITELSGKCVLNKSLSLSKGQSMNEINNYIVSNGFYLVSAVSTQLSVTKKIYVY